MRRFGRLLTRRSAFPSERDWERSVLLQPRTTAYDPNLISDGAGLPFPPSALGSQADQLEPDDPAVGALIAQIARQKPSPGASSMSNLDRWRVLARADDEVLFGFGFPPRLVTVAMRRDARRDTWTALAVSTGRPLRATRDGIRASSWRLDPTHQPNPEDTIVRVLVTEQTSAGGKRADTRLLAPDIHVGAEELTLTMFVTPRPGYQMQSPNPETPARVALPSPIGIRRLVDGALYDRGSTQRS